MKTTARRPRAAAAAATDAERLPVEAQASVWKPHSAARAAATATTRSLNESVGLRESSLTQSASSPRRAARRGACDERRRADAQAAGRQRRDRQQLREAPDRWLARVDELRAADAPGDALQVVGRLERPEAARQTNTGPSAAGSPQARQRRPVKPGRKGRDARSRRGVRAGGGERAFGDVRLGTGGDRRVIGLGPRDRRRGGCGQSGFGITKAATFVVVVAAPGIRPDASGGAVSARLRPRPIPAGPWASPCRYRAASSAADDSGSTTHGKRRRARRAGRSRAARSLHGHAVRDPA